MKTTNNVKKLHVNREIKISNSIIIDIVENFSKFEI